jgi:DNA-binding NtrC family response regulator
VRELRNAIERAVLLGGGQLRRGDLFLSAPAEPRAPNGHPSLPFPDTLEHIESAAARAMLERMSGNKRAAADALGISRSRLYRLLAP